MLNPCPLPMWHWRWNAKLHMLDRMPTTETFPQPYWCCAGYLCHHFLDRSICVSLTSQPILAFWKLPWCYMLCILVIFHLPHRCLLLSLFSSLWVLVFRPLIASFLCTHSILGSANVFLSHLFLWLTDLYSENTFLLCSVCACVFMGSVVFGWPLNSHK